MRSLSAALTALTCLAASALLSAPSAAAVPRFERYVALGDSYAAVGALLDQYGTPGCFRSHKNYPSYLAAALQPGQFVDSTCGDATTANMTTAQFVGLGVNPPQFDALTPDTDLVSVSIGGNDLSLPLTLGPCAALAVSDPEGNPCERYNSSAGFDQLTARIEHEIRPRVAAVLQGIRDRLPDATIVVVNYLSPLPAADGCWPAAPFARGDVAYLTAALRRFATMQLEVGAAVGAIGVDANTVAGHDMCQPAGTRWIEPLLPAAATTPFHPNASGTRAVAELAVAALAD